MLRIRSISRLAPQVLGKRLFSKPAKYYEDTPASELPGNWARRVTLWEEEKQRQQSLFTPSLTPLRVMVGEKSYEALDGETSPLSLGQGKLCHDALLARINGTQLWDLSRSFDLHALAPSASAELRLEYLGYNDALGQQTMAHSAAHVLGQALEYYYRDHDVLLRDGPPLEDGGFFYDVQIRSPSSARPLAVHESDLPGLGALCEQIVAERQAFDRIKVDKKFALHLFESNPFKTSILSSLPDDAEVTLYRCGPLIDLCRGPHIPHTGRIKAIAMTRVSGNVFKAQPAASGAASPQQAPQSVLQRVYGVAFPDAKKMKEWKAAKERADAADHRVLGRRQELFFFHEYSPGSAFFLPHGTRVYNALVAFIRQQYRNRGYDEVRSPLMYHTDLWKTSGHWENYKENMFLVSRGACEHHQHEHAPSASEEEAYEFGLKPMNCPGHCLLFDSKLRSYRDLPLRLADFSDLHRNEFSGALGGLTRVRRFAQDDAHIFCREDQVADEVAACLSFIRDVYGVFGFEFKLRLSTRPEKYVGDLELWNNAEAALKSSLQQFGQDFIINEGDGAFYGPKIDVAVTDAHKREHQCATVQLDFQLPRRFKLSYKGADNEMHTPVMVHRAILGSVERMMAILLEHIGGKWPLWLSPRQVQICPVSEKCLSYANEVGAKLHAAGLYVDVGAGDQTLNKQIREAQLAQYNFIVVAGEKEMADGTINIRTRDGKVHGTTAVDEFIVMLQQLIKDKQ